MRKTIATITAAAFLGSVAAIAIPAPAHAVFPFFVLGLKAKEDKNFKAVNPYAPKKAKKAKGKAKAKGKKKM
jgi:hypothetical protein